MSVDQVIKRDGTKAPFDRGRIENGIYAAAQAVGNGESRQWAETLSWAVAGILEERFGQDDHTPHVEQIQDVVEEVLIKSGNPRVSKAYILYRHERAEARAAQKMLIDTEKLVDDYLQRTDWRVSENSNMNYSLQGLNFYVASSIAARYWLHKIYPPDVQQAHVEGDMHLHDLGMLSVYCCGWDLEDLLAQGFGGVLAKIESKPPRHLRAALGQLVNFFYTLQGEAAGAVAVSNFDTLLAPFIRYDGLDHKAVKQAVQEFVFNINVPTRVGFQTPFSNITMDLTPPSTLREQPVIIGGEPQRETYGEFQREMDMLNRAFAEVMLEGDAKGRVFTFPIPTYSITRDFDWDNAELEPVWAMTARYGIPYFSNFLNSDISPEDVRSMCCRLRLNNRELRKRVGGLFAAAPLTGSVGVVTINMPRLGHLAQDEADFLARLEQLMELARVSLEIKREMLERLTERGLYPYSHHYLQGIQARFGKYWSNHFSTIGLIGMNEACLNLLGVSIAHPEGKAFAVRALEFMRTVLARLQTETGNLYNLEATPAEGASFRLARADKAHFPDIITAGIETAPYYTNCLSSDTESLTKEGWKTYDKLTIGEEVLTYDMVTRTLEYQKVQSIYVYDGDWEMVNIRSRAQDQLVTTNHMVMFEPGSRKGFEYLAPAAGLPKRNFMIRMGASWHIQKDDDQYSDDLLKLVAWIVTEGHFEKDCAGIRIIQVKKSDYWQEIKGILDRLNIEYSILGYGEGKHQDSIFRIAASDGRWIREIVQDKLVPRGMLYSLSERQLNLLLLELAKGDGVIRNGRPIKLYTGSAELAGIYQEIAIKTQKRSVIGYGKGAYYVGIVNPRCKSWIMDPPRMVQHKGTVWCINVPNHTFVARRNGKPFITGNSTHLPVSYSDDLFEVLEHQDKLQTLYTGGTVVHVFLGEQLDDWQQARKLVRTIAENFHLPYYTLTPTFSICPVHGYIPGEHHYCPYDHTEEELKKFGRRVKR